jgi:pimeloyl-ACP methyl ester carboxylesterase
MSTVAERIATSGGVRIAYDVRGTGPPLLLVHGLGYARWGWEPVVDAFGDRFTVVSFDNRGVGVSDAPPGPYRVRELAEDAVAVLDDAGIERTHVVATSLGGMVGQELALEWPERVDRLVLVCTTPGIGGYPMPAQTVRLLMDVSMLPIEERLRRLVENALGSPPDPELVERIVAHRLASPQAAGAWQAQAAAGAAYDALDRLERITAPTLILHGTADVVVDPRNAKLLASRIPGAQLELFSGGGHIFFWEEPERFVQVVSDFLAKGAR